VRDGDIPRHLSIRSSAGGLARMRVARALRARSGTGAGWGHPAPPEHPQFRRWPGADAGGAGSPSPLWHRCGMGTSRATWASADPPVAWRGCGWRGLSEPALAPVRDEDIPRHPLSQSGQSTLSGLRQL